MSQRRGLFITLEGIDGSGKSTALKRLREAIVERGRKVHLTFEPGATQLGERLRDALLSRRKEPMSPMAELLLFFADRAQHLEEIILPCLEEGQVVVCDRFTDSTFAYQGTARGLGTDKVEALERLVQGQLRPDLVLVLDIAPDQARRRDDSDDRIEKENAEFHKRVREGYLQRAEAEPGRYRVIDASRSVEEVAKDMIEALDALFDAK